MIKLKKAQIIFGIIILLVIAFIGGIEINHYQQTKRADQMQVEIDKQINSNVTKDRIDINVVNPKHINISLKGGNADGLADILSAGKPLKKFDFWQYLKNHVNRTADIVQEKFGKGITVSLMDPNNPTKPLYSVRDGKVLYDKGASTTNVN